MERNKKIILIKKPTKHNLTKDNRLIYACKEIAEEFNNFFGSIAQNIDKETPRSK